MIKKLLFLPLILFIIASCSNEGDNSFVVLKGNYLYPNTKVLTIKGDGYSKIIKIKSDGTFSDTLHLTDKSNHYLLSDGENELILYLKNKDNLKVKLSSIDFLKTIKFSGIGSESNNYLAKKALIGHESFTSSFFDLDETQFDKELENIFDKFSDLLKQHKNIDTSLIKIEKREIISLKKAVKQQYFFNKSLKNKFSDLEGKKCPEFNHYINFKGGTTSLIDLRGKYVYIDLWATWCSPCRAEIPYLKKLDTNYSTKNIAFVSISIDKKTSLEAWKAMIKSKDMSGIQLFSNGDKNFIQKLRVNSIPRFIIVNPKGIIINADAPKPSNIKTKQILNKLLN